MMTDRTYIRANDESRRRLARLLETMTPARLATDLGAGWTAASALGHMGFWDRWQAARWELMLAGQWRADEASVLEVEPLANEALEPYWAGLACPDVVSLALESAARLDAIVAGAPDELVDELQGSPSAYLLNRHRHRNEHLDHIERSIAAAETAAGTTAGPGDRSYVQRNRAALDKLRQVVAGLAPADLELATEEGGWTVGQALGHLGFWDRFMASRWRAALAAKPPARPIDMPDQLADMLNEALAPAWHSFSAGAPQAALAEVVAAAEEIDEIVAGLPPEAPVAAVLASYPRQVDRSLHRLDHVAQVEQALARKR